MPFQEKFHCNQGKVIHGAGHLLSAGQGLGMTFLKCGGYCVLRILIMITYGSLDCTGICVCVMSIPAFKMMNCLSEAPR